MLAAVSREGYNGGAPAPGVGYGLDFTKSAAQTFKNSSGWTYAVYDLSVAPQYSSATTVSSVGWWFPGMTTSQSLDVSHIAFFATKAEATAFGKAAAAFDKNPGVYSSTGFGWISSNNKGFGMLRGSNLVSGYVNNYKTYYVGEDYFKRQLGLDHSDDNPDSGIYHLNMYDATKGSLDGLEVTKENGTVTDANFNYVMVSNGEFVYHYEEDLFFEFEGDDDVYLYINGQLVLDIGGAHSISKVTLDLNDYVNEARANVAAARDAGKEPNKRDLALALEDGQTYDFDFYYMERHGVGANFRLATNIVVTDPDMKTNKQAYQGTDINGDPEEILFGGIVDINDRIGYSFSLTNEGNTKLYKLGFQDASIGVNMTFDGGLQLYGAPSVATFKTTAANTKLTISGLNGIVNLDGKTYLTTASEATEITVANKGTHSLTLYQYEPDAENPVNSLFTDANVTVTVGDATSIKNPTVTDGVYALKSGSNSVTVQGIRVCDRYGGPLSASDLVITVDGYASAEDYEAGKQMGTLKIDLFGVKDENGNYTVTPNQQLQSFLANLKDPSGQTDGEEDETEDDSLANPYGHDGLWQHATVKITGFYYSMTEAEKEGNSFTNTVFATAYKFKDSEVPIRSQDRHRVYGLGTFEYYQWAGHTVYLDLQTLWNDVVNAYTRTDDALIEQTDQITQLIAAVEDKGLTALNLEITDKYGIPWDKEYNLYSNETWGAYELTAEDEVRLAEIMAQQAAENTSFTPDMAHIYYFKRDVPEFGETESWNQNWTDVYTYYWSDTDTTLTSWPGQKMYKLNDDTWCYFLPAEAEYIIFGNGYSGWGNQTGDLLLPETALTAVQWDDTKDVIEVTFNTSGRHIFYVKLSTELAAYYHHVVIPVVVYVSETKDSYIVLDYGLKTENVDSESLLIYDDFLANYGMADAEFIGYYTPDDYIRYIPTNGVCGMPIGFLNDVIFITEMQCCTKIIESGAWDTICYHQPTEENNLFNS